MDGYSVTEAASVLGVPIERVWELLARGVLAGAPEGETGMRVFLQPRPAAPPATSGAPPPNGGAGSEPERELSPFRELLTEFRNLTERYGQALLALGESRGEVAALRSRVDLLETRMDMGLPGAGTQRMAAGWASGAQPYGFEQPVAPTVAPPSAAATLPDEPAEAEEHRARPRGPRRATESFAEALARAEDPSPPELPAADAMDSGASTRHEPEASEAVLPRELPVAEPVPVADEPLAPMDPAARAAPDAAPEPVVAQEPEVAPEAPVAPEVAADDAVPVAAPVEPMRWDSDRYSAAIEEPDWFEAEAEAEAGVEAPEVASELAEEDAPEETLFWLRDATADVSPPPQPGAEAFPGADELDSALDALGAIGGTPASAQSDAATEPPEPPDPREPPSPPPPPASVQGVSGVSARAGQPSAAPPRPTGRAYRRLRRIFPD